MDAIEITSGCGVGVQELFYKIHSPCQQADWTVLSPVPSTHAVTATATAAYSHQVPSEIRKNGCPNGPIRAQRSRDLSLSLSYTLCSLSDGEQDYVFASWVLSDSCPDGPW